MTHVLLHPDELIDTADFEYACRLQSDLLDSIVSRELSFFSPAEIGARLKRLTRRTTDASAHESVSEACLNHDERLEIYNCLDSSSKYDLISRKSVEDFTSMVKWAYDVFVLWHPSTRQHEADLILAVAAKMSLATSILEKLLLLDAQTDTTLQLLVAIHTHFPLNSPDPESSQKSHKRHTADPTSTQESEQKPADVSADSSISSEDSYSELLDHAASDAFCSYASAPLAQRSFSSPKFLDAHWSKTSENSSATIIRSTLLVNVDISTSNAHWRRNMYLGMLTWTRCETSRLLHLEPSSNFMPCRKFGELDDIRNLRQSCAFDWQQVLISQLELCSNQVANAPLIVP